MDGSIFLVGFRMIAASSYLCNHSSLPYENKVINTSVTPTKTDEVFPDVRNFCRTVLSEDTTATATAPTRRRRRALKQPPPQPNIALVTTEELPDTST